MINITNQSHLDAYLMKALQNTVNYVVDKIFETNKELIDQIVYGAGSPKMYNRTFEFRESWEKDEAITSGSNEVTGGLHQNWQEMSYDPENFVHGSLYCGDYDYTDVRQGLADIIYNGLSGGLFGQGFWTKPRDVWKPLLQKIESEISSWVITGFEIQGIECRAGSRGNFLYW